MWQMQSLTPLYAQVGYELWKPHCGVCEVALGSGRPLRWPCKLLCAPVRGEDKAELFLQEAESPEG